MANNNLAHLTSPETVRDINYKDYIAKVRGEVGQPSTNALGHPPLLNRGVENTTVLVDWFSGTFPIPEIDVADHDRNQEYLAALAPQDRFRAETEIEQTRQERAARGLAEWLRIPADELQEQPGRYFYRRRLQWDKHHVEILFDGMQENMTGSVHLAMTGQGCREVEQLGRVSDWESFLAEIGDRQGKLTRLDVALDDHAGRVDMQTVFRTWLEGAVTSHYHMQPVMPKLVAGCGQDLAAMVPETLYFGDPRQGESAIRIYDKRHEQISKGQPDPGAWVRVELVTRHDQATELVQQIQAVGLVPAVTGAIRAKLDFKIPEPDKNRARWATVDWWDQLLQSATKVRLTVQTAAQTILQKYRWLERVVAKNLAIVMQAHNYDPTLLNYLLLTGRERFKDRDRQLVRDYAGGRGWGGTVAI